MKNNIENLKVFVRSRPLSPKEKADKQPCIITVVPQNQLVQIDNSDSVPTDFHFEQVFDQYWQQEGIYNTTAFQLVQSVLQGYNGTIFAYGQTGSGKTFTLEGLDDKILKGIIPRTFDQIFNCITTGAKQVQVKVASFQIENENFYDLLNSNKYISKKMREDRDVGVYIEDLNQFVVFNHSELLEKYWQSRKMSKVFGTNMNVASSSIHKIFQITLDSQQNQTTHTIGKLNLVDLAGSEINKNINKSLVALAEVIYALTDQKSNKHIPYRNSKLTRLLQDSLGGNSKSVMIATISPASYNREETLRTLKFMQQAQQIKCKPKINYIEKKEQNLQIFQKPQLLTRKDQVESQRQDTDNINLSRQLQENFDEKNQFKQVKNQTLDFLSNEVNLSHNILEIDKADQALQIQDLTDSGFLQQLSQNNTKQTNEF